MHSVIICEGVGSKKHTPLTWPFQGNHARTYETVQHGQNVAGPGWLGYSFLFVFLFFGFPVPGILGNYFQVPAKKEIPFHVPFFHSNKSSNNTVMRESVLDIVLLNNVSLEFAKSFLAAS
jgi:hypothetical protein